MASPPPPYDSITGISRAVMKDNAQETLANYNGNARPGELVVNLVTDPPVVYVGNNSGQLTQISSGSGGNTGDWVFSAGNATTSTDVEIFVTGYPGQGASVNSDEYAQLYWSANVLGNVSVFDPDGGGTLYTWAYVDSGGFYVQFKDDENNLNYQWTFRNDGNLTLPDGGTIIFEGGDGIIGKNGDDLLISWDNEELVLRSVQGDVDLQADSDVILRARSDGAGDYLTKWIATQNNEFTNIIGDANVIAELGNLNIQGGRDTLASGNVIITAVNTGVAINTWTFDTTGTLTAPGNISAGNIGLSERITCQTVVTDPVNLSSLTPVFGARAFILDGNLVAAGNFGAQVSGGGGNSVPVWSDGTNWYIG
jgi:hypothetical protein